MLVEAQGGLELAMCRGKVGHGVSKGLIEGQAGLELARCSLRHREG